jgi:fumarate hydratase class I
MSEFRFQKIFELGEPDVTFRKLTTDHVSTVAFEGHEVLRVEAEALTLLAAEAIRDVSHLFRPGHLAQLRKILDDPEASDNDRFVALEMLKNANVAAGMVLPSCQDTGTAIVVAHKGQNVYTTGHDEESLARGIHRTYTETNLRYSQMAPLTMYEEKNTGSNLPAQIEIYAGEGNEYELLFITKGGGSANKSYLYQETRALLNPDSLVRFIDEKIRTLGTAACPPYHLAVVIGGTSAEFTLKTVKLASTRYLDTLPTTGNEQGSWRRRSRSWRRRRGSARSSAASTSATTCASSACRGTVHPVRWRSASPAPQTVRSWERSPGRVSSWNSSRQTRRATCPR